MYRYLKNLQLELSVANCMFVEISFIIEKSLHKIRENFSSDETICSWFILEFFFEIKSEFERETVENQSSKLMMILVTRGNHGWSIRRRLMPKIRLYDIVVFYGKSILSPCKNHSQVALWPKVRVTRKKYSDLINFQKYHASETQFLNKKYDFPVALTSFLFIYTPNTMDKNSLPAFALCGNFSL